MPRGESRVWLLRPFPDALRRRIKARAALAGLSVPALMVQVCEQYWRISDAADGRNPPPR